MLLAELLGSAEPRSKITALGKFSTQGWQLVHVVAVGFKSSWQLVAS